MPDKPWINSLLIIVMLMKLTLISSFGNLKNRLISVSVCFLIELGVLDQSGIMF